MNVSVAVIFAALCLFHGCVGDATVENGVGVAPPLEAKSEPPAPPLKKDGQVAQPSFGHVQNTAAREHITNVAKPATNVAKPATNVAKPATNVAKPATNVAKPATNVAKPATNVAKPATASPPANIKSAKTVKPSTPVKAAKTAKPVASHG